jgi:transcriptional regulator with XRE-family HTH domain
MTVGDNIRRIRKSRNMGQIELAKLSGLWQQTISEIETGRRDPHHSSLAKIASGLGVSVAELLTQPSPDEGPPEPPRTPLTNEDAEEFDRRFGNTGPVEAEELREELDAEFMALREFIHQLHASGFDDEAFQVRRARMKRRQAQERLSALALRTLDLDGLGASPKGTVAEYVPSAAETAETLRLMILGDGEERSAG